MQRPFDIKLKFIVSSCVSFLYGLSMNKGRIFCTLRFQQRFQIGFLKLVSNNLIATFNRISSASHQVQPNRADHVTEFDSHNKCDEKYFPSSSFFCAEFFEDFLATMSNPLSPLCRLTQRSEALEISAECISRAPSESIANQITVKASPEENSKYNFSRC